MKKKDPEKFVNIKPPALMMEMHFVGCGLSQLSRLLDAVFMSIPPRSVCWGPLVRNACILSRNDYLRNNDDTIRRQMGVEACGIPLAFLDAHGHAC